MEVMMGSNQGETDISCGSIKHIPKEDLRVVYQTIAASRIDFRDRIWETIRTAALLALGILAAVGGIAAGGVPQALYTILGAILIIVGLYIYWWTRYNVRREQALLYHDEFTLFQIEKLLGLHERLSPDQRWKQNSPYMFSLKHLSPNYKCGLTEDDELDPVEAWVRGRLSRQDFQKRTVIGFASIVSIPLIGIGTVLMVIGISKLV
jgi:hypothetical protein